MELTEAVFIAFREALLIQIALKIRIPGILRGELHVIRAHIAGDSAAGDGVPGIAVAALHLRGHGDGRIGAQGAGLSGIGGGGCPYIHDTAPDHGRAIVCQRRQTGRPGQRKKQSCRQQKGTASKGFTHRKFSEINKWHHHRCNASLRDGSIP